MENWLPLPDVAEALGVPVTRVRQLVREGSLLARRQDDGILRIPAGFVQDGMVTKGLSGTLTLLADAGYSQEEAIDWLLRDDPSLPGTPLQALRENRGKEVKRRAQALGF
ncbi:DNA-binding protein [Frankia sp. CNm7]|uniref:DNA-binding protein n=1 Tax=Frankia nepalensis TaxID=1836974 RepID=A0A937RTI3_9ACTN|nr:Rv2175c family DNA-binding protein [Frankia nepalensis]MBL7501148.1 DNA-binding protein [Frankia nepalensis]MBL7513754.1 DNA-binding protein [Frankia nepalensis]MBL7521093.1 DNA-binding protein [Frankia nepalensis]MBL7631646.1 DNA-binding protein [Frankia nepalensis]